MKIVIFVLTFVVSSSGVVYAKNCPQTLPKETPRLLHNDTNVINALRYLPSHKPLYMNNPRGHGELNHKAGPRSYFAGCYGDFDHNRQRDYALLLLNPKTQKMQAFAFVAKKNGYKITALGSAMGPYKVLRHRPVSQGGDPNVPFCWKRPAAGIINVWECERYRVTGDIIVYGWYAYLWQNDNSFRSILIGD